MSSLGCFLEGVAVAHKSTQSLPPHSAAHHGHSVLHIAHLLFITDVLAAIFYVRMDIAFSLPSTSQLCLLPGASDFLASVWYVKSPSSWAKIIIPLYVRWGLGERSNRRAPPRGSQFCYQNFQWKKLMWRGQHTVHWYQTRQGPWLLA